MSQANTPAIAAGWSNNPFSENDVPSPLPTIDEDEPTIDEDVPPTVNQTTPNNQLVAPKAADSAETSTSKEIFERLGQQQVQPLTDTNANTSSEALANANKYAPMAISVGSALANAVAPGSGILVTALGDGGLALANGLTSSMSGPQAPIQIGDSEAAAPNLVAPLNDQQSMASLMA